MVLTSRFMLLGMEVWPQEPRRAGNAIVTEAMITRLTSKVSLCRAVIAAMGAGCLGFIFDGIHSMTGLAWTAVAAWWCIFFFDIIIVPLLFIVVLLAAYDTYRFRASPTTSQDIESLNSDPDTPDNTAP
jgi:hypothetical protein